MGNGLCFFCKHINKHPQGDEMECAAFPAGIPRTIILGCKGHFKQFKSQTGNFVFEPDDPKLVSELFPAIPISKDIDKS
ncbi:hypothetical protein GCM10027341_09700 [Spirosoma knui]